MIELADTPFFDQGIHFLQAFICFAADHNTGCIAVKPVADRRRTGCHLLLRQLSFLQQIREKHLIDGYIILLCLLGQKSCRFVVKQDIGIFIQDTVFLQRLPLRELLLLFRLCICTGKFQKGFFRKKDPDRIARL